MPHHIAQATFRPEQPLRELRAIAGRWDGLLHGLDLLEEGVAIYRDGLPSYRNRALRRLLGAEEQRDRLLGEVDRCVGRLTALGGEAAVSPSTRRVSRVLRTPHHVYRLIAGCLGSGDHSRPLVVMVVIQPAVPPLPARRELRSRYGLTPRQAEIALLLARGRSNREIAGTLMISQHTVRHHAQRALEKIGCSSRKALALRLLSDRQTSPR